LDNTQQLISDYIVKEFLGDNSVTITANDNLIEEGIIDSLAMLRLIQFVEEQFSVSIQPEDVIIENFESLDTISTLVENKKK
jgi:acyl carrier protein